MITDIDYGVRLFYDGTEDQFDDVLDLSYEQALDIIRFHHDRAKMHLDWRITRAVLLVAPPGAPQYLEQIEEEEAHDRQRAHPGGVQ